MLFTTPAFVFLFLPIVLAGYFLLGRFSARGALSWLFLASVFFYGYWMPVFTLLLVASILGNFGIGLRIMAANAEGDAARARRWMMLGVWLNLGLLGYFKYANFFIDNLNSVLGTQWPAAGVILPIGISFYSFTQIAFLVDTAKGKVHEAAFIHYGLFVTYFPHLVAGPVLHHAQMMPQFAQPDVRLPRRDHLVAGLCIFALGLFKKVVLADGVSPYADAVFDAADAGHIVAPHEAWLGALAYTVQLYFDFSGYSDMAIGLSWLFNVRLPINFDAPYRAASISDFWRRWHISLSTFLRDYLYIALGGNRRGPVRRYLNLAATMVLGGLWHGAAWTFVVWGSLHGLYLMINHGFRAAVGERWARWLASKLAWRVFAWAVTLLSVVLAWVFFRAKSLEGAAVLLESMAFRVPSETEAVTLWNAGLAAPVCAGWCLVLGVLAVFGPTSNEIGEWLLQRLRAWRAWYAALASAALCVVCVLVIINTARDSVSAFIYFNF